MIAIGKELLQISLRRGMGIHVEVHCRSHENGNTDFPFFAMPWRNGRRALSHAQIGGDEHVVCYAVCHFADGACRSRRDEHCIGPHTEVDMGVPTAVAAVEELADDRLVRQGRERQGRDKLLGCRRHHDLHLGSLLDEEPHQEACFVGCNASRNAKDYLLIFQHTLMQVVQVFVLCSE